jgi:hypothetical protein
MLNYLRIFYALVVSLCSPPTPGGPHCSSAVLVFTETWWSTDSKFGTVNVKYNMLRRKTDVLGKVGPWPLSSPSQGLSRPLVAALICNN